MRKASERDPDMRTGVCLNCGQDLSGGAAGYLWVGTNGYVCSGGVDPDARGKEHVPAHDPSQGGRQLGEAPGAGYRRG